MFSVLMSVYNGERVEYFEQALDSVLNQTLKADEIVLIRDGRVYEELQKSIDKYVSRNKTIKYYPLEENVGLGKALNYGVLKTTNELVFRMDTDDISCLDRFEKQYKFMIEHPEIDVLGGQILEFIESKDQPVSKRSVPIDDDSIKNFLKTRNPFNHMTVAFKKSKVIECGNYLDLHYLEDYYLWCRMSLLSCKFHNLEDVIVYARIGEEMFQRRGGLKYFKAWKRLENYKLKNRIINRFQYVKTLSMRFIVQVLFPNRLRGSILKRFARG